MSKLLDIKNITQRFGGLVAVSDFCAQVNAGEIVGIIGPNGAGKTTLFNIITGIYNPTEGKVIFKEKNITGLKPHQITAQGLARTYQNIRLFENMTVIENVMVGMHCQTKIGLFDAMFKTKKQRTEEKYTEEKALEYLKLVKLENHRYDLAKNLPYGSQRKLEIARAMAAKPAILLLDEPAAGMNENETYELMNFIKSIRDLGYTIILIEHDMKLVMNTCDRIYCVDHGALIAQGIPEEIKCNSKVIEAYLGKEV